MIRSVRRRWRWVLTALLAAQLLPLAVADNFSPRRNQNLALVESFCVDVKIQDDNQSAEERGELEQEIADRLSDDAVLYDLPLADSCLFTQVSFSALVSGSRDALRYDLRVVRRDAGDLLDPTIYSFGGITIFNRTATQDRVAEELLEGASELFRIFALDWREAQ